MDSVILFIADKLGIDPLLLPVYLGLLVAVANVVGKSIPASATGALAYVRKVAPFIGLYVPQKITPGVTTRTVAKAIAAEIPDVNIKAAANQLHESVETGIPAGQMNLGPAEGSIVPEEYRTDPFKAQKSKRGKNNA